MNLAGFAVVAIHSGAHLFGSIVATLLGILTYRTFS